MFCPRFEGGDQNLTDAAERIVSLFSTSFWKCKHFIFQTNSFRAFCVVQNSSNVWLQMKHIIWKSSSSRKLSVKQCDVVTQHLFIVVIVVCVFSYCKFERPKNERISFGAFIIHLHHFIIWKSSWSTSTKFFSFSIIAFDSVNKSSLWCCFPFQFLSHSLCSIEKGIWWEYEGDTEKYKIVWQIPRRRSSSSKRWIQDHVILLSYSHGLSNADCFICSKP